MIAIRTPILEKSEATAPWKVYSNFIKYFIRINLKSFQRIYKTRNIQKFLEYLNLKERNLKSRTLENTFD